MKWIAFTLLLFTTALNAQPVEIQGYKQLEDLTIESAHLGYKKYMQVYAPEGYDAKGTKKYPLVIIFDRQNVINCNYQLQTIGYLTTFGQMPQCIVITVESHLTKRGAETMFKATDANGLAEKTEGFIMDELIPYANKNYHTNSFELLIGHSRYGYFTTYMLSKHVDKLNGVISISPFYKQTNVNLVDSMLARLQANKDVNNNVYYMVATGDSVTDTHDYSIMQSAFASQKLPAYFKTKGYEFYSGYHMAIPGLTVGNALYDIFSPWALAAVGYYNDTASTQTEKAKYDKYMATITYGDTLPFSLGTLNGKAWQYYNNSRKDKAIEAWQVALGVYPGYSEIYLYMAQAAKDLNKPYHHYIRLYKDNIKKSTYYTNKDRKELSKELRLLKKP